MAVLPEIAAVPDVVRVSVRWPAARSAVRLVRDAPANSAMGSVLRVAAVVHAGAPQRVQAKVPALSV
jgi:hypothetical protein